MKLTTIPVFEEADKGGGAGAAGAGDKVKSDPNKTAGENAAADKGGEKQQQRTAMDVDDDADKGGQQQQGLPENWRTHFHDEGDTATAEELGRYKTPKDLAKALVEQKKQLRKGALAAEDAPDGEKDPEGLKKWREARGIPLDETGYVIPDAVKSKITDADKPLVEAFTKHMHKKNAAPNVVAQSLEFYYDLAESQAAAQSQADQDHMRETQEEMRGKWGADTKRNSRAAARMAREIVPGVDFMLARGPDGRMLGNDPRFVDAMHELSIKTFGEGAYEGGDAGVKSTGRLEELRGLMKKDIKEWRRHPEWAAEMQTLQEQADRRRA